MFNTTNTVDISVEFIYDDQDTFKHITISKSIP